MLFNDFIKTEIHDTIEQSKQLSNRSCESRFMSFLKLAYDAKFCLHYHFRPNVCDIDESIQIKIMIYPKERADFQTRFLFYRYMSTLFANAT